MPFHRCAEHCTLSNWRCCSIIFSFSSSPKLCVCFLILLPLLPHHQHYLCYCVCECVRSSMCRAYAVESCTKTNTSDVLTGGKVTMPYAHTSMTFLPFINECEESEKERERCTANLKRCFFFRIHPFYTPHPEILVFLLNVLQIFTLPLC